MSPVDRSLEMLEMARRKLRTDRVTRPDYQTISHRALK
jgi:hypothetical protein